MDEIGRQQKRRKLLDSSLGNSKFSLQFRQDNTGVFSSFVVQPDTLPLNSLGIDFDALRESFLEEEVTTQRTFERPGEIRDGRGPVPLVANPTNAQAPVSHGTGRKGPSIRGGRGRGRDHILQNPPAMLSCDLDDDNSLEVTEDLLLIPDAISDDTVFQSLSQDTWENVDNFLNVPLELTLMDESLEVYEEKPSPSNSSSSRSASASPSTAHHLPSSNHKLVGPYPGQHPHMYQSQSNHNHYQSHQYAGQQLLPHKAPSISRKTIPRAGQMTDPNLHTHLLSHHPSALNFVNYQNNMPYLEQSEHFGSDVAHQPQNFNPHTQSYNDSQNISNYTNSQNYNNSRSSSSTHSEIEQLKQKNIELEQMVGNVIRMCSIQEQKLNNIIQEISKLSMKMNRMECINETDGKHYSNNILI